MFEMISKILLGYYAVVAVALLVFLTWIYIDDPEPPPDPDAHLRDNVVKFTRDN